MIVPRYVTATGVKVTASDAVAESLGLKPEKADPSNPDAPAKPARKRAASKKSES